MMVAAQVRPCHDGNLGMCRPDSRGDDCRYSEGASDAVLSMVCGEMSGSNKIDEKII